MKTKKSAACSPFCEAEDLQPTTKDMTLSSLTADDLDEVDDASIQNLTTNDEEVAPKSTGGNPKAPPMRILLTYRNTSCSQRMKQPMNTVG